MEVVINSIKSLSKACEHFFKVFSFNSFPPKEALSILEPTILLSTGITSVKVISLNLLVIILFIIIALSFTF